MFKRKYFFPRYKCRIVFICKDQIEDGAVSKREKNHKKFVVLHRTDDDDDEDENEEKGRPTEPH